MQATKYPSDVDISPNIAREQSSPALLLRKDCEPQATERPLGIPSVTTRWLTFVFVPKLVVEADLPEPKTIASLAEEQRRFLATIREPLEDVELPSDA